MRRLVMASVLLLWAGTTLAAQTAAAKGSGPLQGTWTLTQINGKPPAAGSPDMALAFDGNRYAQVIDGKVVETGSFTAKITATTIDLDLAIGGTGPNAGQRQLGHCVLKGNEVHCRLNAPGATQRPTDVTPQPGQFQFVGKKR